MDDGRRRTTDKGRSQQLTMSTLCSGELKKDWSYHSLDSVLPTRTSSCAAHKGGSSLPLQYTVDTARRTGTAQPATKHQTQDRYLIACNQTSNIEQVPHSLQPNIKQYTVRSYTSCAYQVFISLVLELNLYSTYRALLSYLRKIMQQQLSLIIRYFDLLFIFKQKNPFYKLGEICKTVCQSSGYDSISQLKTRYEY